MASKKNIQINSWEVERERFSSFVVDLRGAARQAEARLEEAGRISKEASHKISAKLSRSEQAFKQGLAQAEKVVPDLLSATNQIVTRWSEDGASFIKQEKSRARLVWKNCLGYFKGRRFNFWLGRSHRRSFASIIREKQLILGRRFITPAPPSAPRRPSAHLFKSRPLLIFAVILLLIIAPLKILSYFEFLDIKGLEAKLRERSQLALNNLLAAGDSAAQLDFQAADSHFQEAGRSFLDAQAELDKISNSLLTLISFSSSPKLQLAAASKKFVAAGLTASSLGSNLAVATDSLFSDETGSFSKRLSSFSYYGNLAVVDAQKLQAQLADINIGDLPPEYQDKFRFLQNQSAQLQTNLANFIGLVDSFKEILGLSRDRRYLLVFQNNSELRASGGFLGSYALVDFRDGHIRNLEVPGGGSYDTEAGLKVKVKAPEPLWLVNPLWHFWDANWWPDWPTTAQNLMWFYEKSAGPTVDGVISFTPTVVESLLKITGPIDLSAEYGLVIDENNFWETVQRVVESQNLARTNAAALADLPLLAVQSASSSPLVSSLPLKQDLENNSANKPKKIIGDLLVKILEVLPSKLTRDNLLPIVSLLEENLASKQVLFYFTDPDLQAAVSRRNWGGEIRPTSGDYLLVVNTNIAGQKSDRKIVEKVEHQSLVGEDGAIVNTVTISRTHQGLKNEPLVGVRNVDWLRLYVPLGSQLISASGFTAPDAEYLQDRPEADWLDLPALAQEFAATQDPDSGLKIYSENDKTVFANWVMVDPGETALVTIKYRLPFNFLDNFSPPTENNWSRRLADFLNPDAVALLPYSLLVQKQPGAQPSVFTSRLYLPSNLAIFWRHPANLAGESGWQINDSLASDKYWSIIAENK